MTSRRRLAGTALLLFAAWEVSQFIIGCFLASGVYHRIAPWFGL